MATSSFNQREYDQIKEQRDRLANQLAASRTGYDYTGSAKPTSQDLYTEAQMKALDSTLERMKGSEISERWYGSGKDEDRFTTGKLSQGPFSTIMNMLSAPLRTVVGGIQGITGTGPKKGILESMKYNATEGGATFGDLLEKAGAPKVVSAPVGFALDMAADPINWLTVGTTALVPRTVAGLLQGGVKGAATGAASRLGQVALNVADWVPDITSPFRKGKLTSLGKTKTAFDLSKKTLEAGKQYSALTGINKLDTLGEGILGLSKGFNVGADEAPRTLGTAILRKAEDLIGAENVKKFYYSTLYKGEINRLLDTTPDLLDDTLRVFGQAEKPSADDINNFVQKWKDTFIKGGVNIDDATKIKNAGKSHGQILKETADGIVSKADKITKTKGHRITNPTQLDDAMTAVANEESWLANDMRRLARQKRGETGWDWFDEKAAKLSSKVKEVRREGQFRSDLVEMADDLVKSKKPFEEFTDLEKLAMKEKTSFDDFVSKKYTKAETLKEGFRKDLLEDKRTVGEKVLDFYNSMGQLFKFGKVGASPSAIVNAYMGNPMMYFAAGGDLSSDYLNAIWQAHNIVTNKKGAHVVLRKVLESDDLIKTALMYPGYFKGTFGADFTDITNNLLKETAASKGLASGLIKASDDPVAYSKAIDEVMGQIRKTLDKLGDKDTLTKELSAFKRGSQVVKERLESGQIPMSQNMFSFEISDKNASYFNKIRKGIEDMAAKGDVGAVYLDKFTNGLGRVFERADQVSKFGTAIHMTTNGLSEQELSLMSRILGIQKKHITNLNNPIIKHGQPYYTINWDKAMDAANEIFMNYSAMPAAVRVMRSIPLLNSPFISFSYAMLPKFGKALIHNPAAFNKMNFAMKEFQGTKSPIERAALEDKYYSWYNSPGMVRLPDLPFFSENPIYLNMANMNPFYSTSFGEENMRKYKNTYLEQTAAALDKLGLFQNPVAQVIKDYGIIPALMARGEVAQGRFGQALYPRDAKGLEKLGYATRAVVDAYTPKVASMGIGALAGALMPKSMEEGGWINTLPGYEARKIAQAMKGKSVIGVPKKAPRLVQTMQALSSTSGLPLYELNTAFTEAKAKKAGGGK